MALNECLCWKSYTCLLCEDIANGRVKIIEDKIVRVVRPARDRNVSALRPVAKCGTRAGYNKHRREQTETCADCRKAQSDYVNEIQKRKRAS